MLGKRLLKSLGWTLLIAALALTASACYKDAGEDLQPTSRQVNLTDLTPTTPAPPAATGTPLETAQPQETATRTLVPTTTPADAVAEPPSPTPGMDQDTPVPSVPQATPQSFMPGITPATLASPTPGVAITTPDMSDILASPSFTPTIDPSRQPVTPTALVAVQDECIHIVRPGDTLYSIARDQQVELNALVAANPQLLGGNPNTVLQIGWQLRLPGCETETPTPAATAEATAAVAGSTGGTGGQTVHIVKPGEGIYSIARLYGIDPQALIAANNLTNPNLIYPGDQLIIPAAP